MTLKREQLEQIARKHGTDLRGGQAPEWLNWTEDQVLTAMEEAIALAVEQCAQICEQRESYHREWGEPNRAVSAKDCAAAIRAELGKK